MIIPPLSQLPVFMGFTILLNRLSTDPTPFDSESFLTLTSLAHSDPTMALPLALGFLTMLNVESRNWFMNAAERERQQALEGQPHISNLIKPVLRGLSIVRIVVAALTPGVSLMDAVSLGQIIKIFFPERNSLLGYFCRLWTGSDLDDGLD
jgi:inner membrane protein COX18